MAQGHTASKWQNWNSNPGLPTSRVLALRMAFPSSLQSYEGGRAELITCALKVEKPSLKEACDVHKIQESLKKVLGPDTRSCIPRCGLFPS